MVWSNHATREAIGDEHHQDKQWASHAVWIDTSAMENLKLSWEIETDRGLTMGGWTIDDVCLYTIKEPAPLDEDDVKGSAECGCSGVSRTGWQPWWILAGLVALRRRRQ